MVIGMGYMKNQKRLLTLSLYQLWARAQKVMKMYGGAQRRSEMVRLEDGQTRYSWS
jgi:hypothetical protein